MTITRKPRVAIRLHVQMTVFIIIFTFIYVNLINLHLFVVGPSNYNINVTGGNVAVGDSGRIIVGNNRPPQGNYPKVK